MLVLARFGQNAGLLGGFLETTQRAFDRLSRRNANFHEQPSLPTGAAKPSLKFWARMNPSPDYTLSRGPGQMPSRQDVQMQVAHGLSPVGSLINNDAVALSIALKTSPYLGCSGKEPRLEIG